MSKTNIPNKTISARPQTDRGRLALIRRDFRKNHLVYLLAVLGIAYYIIFHYMPMYGAIIAFKTYRPSLGIMGSPWVGFENFISFFKSIYFSRLVRNTVAISVLELIFAFPAPIILALLLNEIRSRSFKRIVQTITYIPHFISIIVVCGMIMDFFSYNGLINNIITAFGGKPTIFLLDPKYFRPIYVGSGIWQSVGWGTIIYLAALSNIDLELYDAAMVDGAGRLRQAWHVTLPGIIPTIMILLILRIGSLMSVGYEKILLLYNANTYETADVISTYVYRRGLLNGDYSFASAVGLFNSVINFALLISSNKLSNKLTESSLW
ncbi:MAG: ABC transporter permease subunit [Treponema sp.]|nr:ABC transporter permease subunit [Treponema sp.]